MDQRERAIDIAFEELTTDLIISWSQTEQESLRSNLSEILQQAFPIMPATDREEFLVRFFRKPSEGTSRKVILVKDKSGNLFAVSLFDHARVRYDDKLMEAVYLNLRAVVPDYQSLAIGQGIALRVLMNLQPDILMTTCTQSSSLHSWIRLQGTGLIEGFEVFPQIEQQGQRHLVVHLPYKELPLVVSLFEQMYFQIVNCDAERVAEAMGNLTVRMVRRDVHHGMYDFHPWERRGRMDPVAQALGLTEKDGVLVVFKKLREADRR